MTTLCSLKTYSLLLNAGLEDLKLGSIPPSLDQVLVGSLDRTRQPECRVTFLMGAPLRVTSPESKGKKGSSQTETERHFSIKG